MAAVLWTAVGCDPGGGSPTPPDRPATWAHSLGEGPAELTADAAGAIYTLGARPLEVDGDVLVAAGEGQHLAAFDGGGGVAWARAVAGVSSFAGTGSGVALLGVCGADEPCAFDDGTGAPREPGLHLTALDAEGSTIWSHAFAPSSGELDGVEHVVGAAPDGAVVVVGILKGTVDLGAGPLVSDAEGDLYVARFDPAGQLSFARLLPEAGGAYATMPALAVASAAEGGALTLYGISHGGLDPGLRDGPLPAGLFVLELAASGESRRALSVGPGVEFVGRSSVSLSRDAAGGLAFTARLLGGAVQVGSFTDEGGATVVKLDPDWELAWGQTLEGASIDRAVSAPGGDVFLAVACAGAIDVGGVAYPPAREGCHYLVARLGTHGEHVWSSAIPYSPEGEGSVAIARAGDGVVVMGYAAAPVDLGDGRPPLAAGTFLARFPP